MNAGAVAPLIGLHVLAAVVWVGGMFFAYVVLRPAVGEALEAPLPARLWLAVLRRFLAWVWAAVGALLVSGYGLVLAYGGLAAVGMHVHVMQSIGWVMFSLFAGLYFGPFRRLQGALADGDGAAAATALAGVRRIVGVNLVLGLVLVVVASAGRFL